MPHPPAKPRAAPARRRWRPRVAATLACMAILAGGPAAHGQASEPLADPVELDPWREGALLAGSAVALIVGPLFVPVDTTQQPTSEWFPGDESVKDNFSLRADRVSDVSIAVAVAAPLLLHLPLDEPSAKRTLVYGESIAVNLGLVQMIKYVVQRPRPFNHSPDGRVRRFADRRGEDSYLSFFSSHASTSFTAAVASSYLHGLHTDSVPGRAAVWGAHLALAAATANLRVRAGRHYYSDIAVGAVVGMGIGVGVPLLHVRDRDAYVPSAAEWAAMTGGLLLGFAVGQLVPLEDDPGAGAAGALARVRLVPMAGRGAAGLLLAGEM